MKKLFTCLFIFFIPTLSYAQTQTAYIPGKATKYDIGQGSNVNFDLNFRYGTSGSRIIFGTETCSGVGTSGVVVGSSSAAPQMEFTYSGGISTLNIKNTNVKVNGLELVTMETAIASVSGAGTDTTLTNPNLEGAVDMGTSSSINANGANISDDELSFLNGLYGNVQNQLDTKVGSTTPRVAVITCGGTSTAGAAGSSTVRFQGGGDLTTTMTDDGGGLFTITTSLAGSTSAKPDILEGGVVVGTQSSGIAFNTDDFDVVQNGGISTISLSTYTGIAFIGTNSVFTVPPNITTIFVTATGGGGGGVARSGYWNIGGGGGGSAGSYVDFPLTVTPNATVTVYIGLGGESGVDGGDTSITYPGSSTTALTCSGGKKGTNNDSSFNPGGGGGDQTNYGGISGSVGGTGDSSGGGYGAGNLFGGQIAGPASGNPPPTALGWGNGGAGGGLSSTTGGAGSKGFCLIKY